MAYKPKRKKGEPNPTIECACGCGQTFEKYDKYDRPRMFIKEHRHFLPLPMQFEKFVIRKEGCWGWMGTKNNHGYPQIRHNKKIVMGHRASFELFKGAIPEGLDVLHRCDNPECTNPDHLFLGTHLDNMHDMIQKGRGKGRRTYSDEFVAKLREVHKSGKYNYNQLSKLYGIDRDYISRIVNNKARATAYDSY